MSKNQRVKVKLNNSMSVAEVEAAIETKLESASADANYLIICGIIPVFGRNNEEIIKRTLTAEEVEDIFQLLENIRI